MFKDNLNSKIMINKLEFTNLSGSTFNIFDRNYYLNLLLKIINLFKLIKKIYKLIITFIIDWFIKN